MKIELSAKQALELAMFYLNQGRAALNNVAATTDASYDGHDVAAEAKIWLHLAADMLQQVKEANG